PGPRSPLFAQLGLALWGGDFLNGNDAWLFYKSTQPVPSKVVVLATTDGGQRWGQAGELPAGCYGGVGEMFSGFDVDFVDAEHGWCGLESSGASAPNAIYRTADGGRTWQTLDGPGVTHHGPVGLTEPRSGLPSRVHLAHNRLGGCLMHSRWLRRLPVPHDRRRPAMVPTSPPGTGTRGQPGAGQYCRAPRWAWEGARPWRI
ncbi:MAG: WD40/YVTN/BNR-like repeat-containing protein, partial [Acidimicrobiales bacterium]